MPKFTAEQRRMQIENRRTGYERRLKALLPVN
jgi:hypothetical protein